MRKTLYIFVLISILFLIICSDSSSGINTSIGDQSVETNSIHSNKFVPVLLQQVDPIIITDDQSLASHAAQGDGTENDPFIIEGLEINPVSLQHGISINGTTKYIIIRNNYIEMNGQIGVHGIFINTLANNTVTVENNTVLNNDIGIYIYSGPFTKVTNNNISNNLNFGIEIADGAHNSEVSFNNISAIRITGINVEASNSRINNNLISMNFKEEIKSFGIGVHRDNVIVQNNTVTRCWEGINISPVSNIFVSNNIVDGCTDGITGWPNESLITGNVLKNGGFNGNGIRLQSEVGWDMPSNDNRVSYNTINNFEGYGINIIGNGKNNIFEFNRLFGNSYEILTSSQANDNGENNTIIENYWNEWTSPDQNSDGYVDFPYAISGSANNNDNLPLAALDLSSINLESISSREEVDDAQLEFNLNSNYIIPIFLVVFTSALVVPGVKIWKMTSNRAVQKVLYETLEGILGFAPPLLVGIINSDADQSVDQDEVIPLELKKYKFLLNPIRLSIIKLLYMYSSYPAFMIRDILQISWGKFSSHVNSLINKGYISVQEEFHEGSPTRVLYMEYLGSNTYLELQDVLKRLFEMN